MKYCTKCGSELFDYAVVCTKCGCAVKQSHQTPPPPPPSAEPKNFNFNDFNNFSNFAEPDKSDTQKSSLPLIFDFIFDLFAIFVCLMLGISISNLWIYESVYGNGIRFYYDETSAILAMILSFPAAILAIASFVSSLITRSGMEELFRSTKRLFFGAALLILSICLMSNI